MKDLRTGLSWADRFRAGAEAWFNRQMKALEPFDITADLVLHTEIPRNRTKPYKSTQAEDLLGSFWGYAGLLERVYDGLEPTRTLLHPDRGTSWNQGCSSLRAPSIHIPGSGGSGQGRVHRFGFTGPDPGFR